MLDTRKTVKVGGEVGQEKEVMAGTVRDPPPRGGQRGKKGQRARQESPVAAPGHLGDSSHADDSSHAGADGGRVSGESKLAGVVNELEARLRAAQVRLDKTQKIRRRVQENSKKQGKLGMQEREAVKRLSKEQREALGQIEVQARVVEELEGVCTLVRAALDDERRASAVAAASAVVEEAVEDRVEDRVEGNDAVIGASIVERQVSEAVKKMVQLMYCACLFDPFVPYQVEKAAMLAWMHHTQDVHVHMGLPRFAEMLDAIGVLGKMMTRRPLGEGKSHEESVRYCEDVALRYVLGGEESLLGWSGFMTKTQVQGALEQIMTSDYFRSEGLMCGGGGGGARPGMHGPVHQVTSQPQDGSMQGQDQEQEQWLSDENDKGERAKVSTPSLVQDQVGIAMAASEGTDSSSDRAEESEVDVDMVMDRVDLGADKHPAPAVLSREPVKTGSAAEAQAASVKKKSAGGKKKGKSGKPKDLPNTSSPISADRGAPRGDGTSGGVIQTTHGVLPQRAPQKVKKGE